MSVRILDALGCDLVDGTPAERERARLVVASSLVGAAFFAVETFVQAARSNLPFAAVAGFTALAFAVLPALVRLGPSAWIGHAVAALIAFHCLFKLAVTGGDTRAFAFMALLPLIAVPLCGMRASAVWVLGLCAAIGALWLGEATGRPFPIRFEAGLVERDGLLVAISAGLGGLVIATWYQTVFRASEAEVARSRAQTDLAQAELLENHERNRALLAHAFDGVLILDRDFRITYLSPGSEGRLLGYGRGAVAAGGFTEFVEGILHPDDRSASIEAFRLCHETPGKLIRSTVRLRKASGEYSTFEASAHNLMDDPAVAGIVVNYRDISNATTLPTAPSSAHATPDEPRSTLR